MSLVRGSIDRKTLAMDMLPLTKQHMRVDYDRDDEYIVFCLRRAIDQFSRLTEWNVFSQDYTWRMSAEPITYSDLSAVYPNSVSFISAWQVPIGPLGAYIVKVDGFDVSMNYVKWSNTDVDRYGTVYLAQIGTTNMPDPAIDPIPVATLTIGYAKMDDMPPALQDCIMRMAAWYFENREMAATPGVDMMDYFNSLLAAYWIPRC